MPTFCKSVSPEKDVTQSDTQDDTQDDTQGDTQDDTQDVPESVTIACPQGGKLARISKRISPLIGTSELSHNFHGEKRKTSHISATRGFSL